MSAGKSIAGLGLGIFFLLSTAAQGATWYVDGDHLTSGAGTSWHEAMVTIQEAVSAATSGDEIWVKQGVYDLTTSINIDDKDVRLYGGFTGLESAREQRDWVQHPTIIDGTGSAGKCLVIQHDLPTVDGFTVRNCANGAVWLNDCLSERPIINNMVFLNNGAPGINGGALDIYNSSPIITNTTFVGNQAGLGGAIYNNCLSAPSIVNSTFTQNSATNGGAIYNIKFCGLPGEPVPTVSNSILWGNSATDAGPEIDFSVYPVLVYYSDIDQDGYAGTDGNIRQDPMMFGAERPHLREGSPAIDVGNNSAIDIPAKDFDGDDRIIDGNETGVAIVDMGADELVPGATFGIWYVDGDVVSSGDGTSWDTAVKTITEAVGNALAGDEIWIKAGTYIPDEGSVIAPLNITVEDIALYGGFAGGETQREQRDWQANETIIDGQNSVSRTIYVGSDGGIILDGLTITGHLGSSAAVEFTNGSKLNTAANSKFTGNTGIVVKGGQSDLLITGSRFENNNGASVSVSGTTGKQVTVKDSLFINNLATALTISGSHGMVDRCKFMGNSTDFSGAGIHVLNGDGVDVSNSLFVSNHAEQSANNGGGGAIYMASGGQLSVLNSTFYDNSTAGKGGSIGAFTVGDAYYVTNSILWGGSAAIDFADLFGNAQVIYSSLDQAGIVGTGNISTRPDFVDETDLDPLNWDYQLEALSPGIDAGDNSLVDICSKDLNAQQRFADDPDVDDTGVGTGSIVDMGAYERQTGGVAEQYALTMGVVGSGATIPAVGVHSYPVCTLVDLTAIADTSWEFVDWTGNVADPLTEVTRIAMIGDQGVTANFKQVVTLTVELQGTGSASAASVPAGIDCGIDCSESYDANTQVTLSATVDAGSIFAGWIGGGCSGTGACEMTLGSDTKVVLPVNPEGACGEGNAVTLADVTADADNTITACESITAGNGFKVEAPSDVTFIAGDHVSLTGGFSVSAGAGLSIQTGP